MYPFHLFEFPNILSTTSYCGAGVKGEKKPEKKTVAVSYLLELGAIE